MSRKPRLASIPRHRLWPPLLALAAIHGAVLFAGFLAPYDPGEQHRDFPYAPPVHVHFVDAGHKLHLRPFVYPLTARVGSDGYDEDRSRACPARLFVHRSSSRASGVLQSHWRLLGVDEPAILYLFGSDGYGRDQFSRLLYGGRISLLAGLLAAALSLGAGAILGAISGYYGGWTDDVVMRGAELFLALPWLYLLFAVRAFLPLAISPEQAFLLLIAVVGTVGWARPARLVRSIVLSGKERPYVLAARGFGASDLYLLRRHILPQTFGVILTQAAILIPQYVLAEAALSFLGLGVGEPVPSWGNLLGALEHYNVLVSYWWMFLPGVALIPLFVAYHTLADALHARAELIQT